MAVSQSPDTTSRIAVPTSRIIEKLEIAYGVGLDFWTLGFWPNVGEKLLRRDISLLLAWRDFWLKSLGLIMLIGVDVFQRLRLLVVTSSGQKGQFGGAGYWDVGVMTGGWVYLAKDLGG